MSTPAPSADSPSPWRKRLLLLVKLVLTVAIFVAMFRVADLGFNELIAELKAAQPARLLPWMGVAVAIKLVGIFGNVWRWQLLLRGQDLHLRYRFLAGSFFVGRFFGIVTPGTLGLDGFRLYDSIRVTRKPVPCAAVIAIDKGVGLVSLVALLAIVFPLGWEILPIKDERRAMIVLAVIVLGAAAALTALMAPGWTRPLLALVPGARAKGFARKVLDAATAYAGHRKLLLAAVGLAIIGHLTTALMYWALLMGLSDAGAPALGTVLFAALLMTSATLVGPTVGGEGIREFVFVKLLEGLVAPARAFLFGHLGFWIEKGLLGLPGGLIYALRKEAYDGPITAADLERVKREATAEDGAADDDSAGTLASS